MSQSNATLVGHGDHLWSEDTNGITYTAGNVGIGGASSSSSELKVEGSGDGIVTINSTSSYAGLSFEESGASRFSLRTVDGTNGLKFYDSGASAERMRIDSTGDCHWFNSSGTAKMKWDVATEALGIGTNSPREGGSQLQSKLDVAGPAVLGHADDGRSLEIYSTGTRNVTIEPTSSEAINELRIAQAGWTGDFTSFYAGSGSEGSSAEALRISSDGAFGLSGANYGTSGQVLTSAGSSAVPTWEDALTASPTPVDGQIGVWTGSDQLEGQSTLTYEDGGYLYIQGTSTPGIDIANLTATTGARGQIYASNNDQIRFNDVEENCQFRFQNNTGNAARFTIESDGDCRFYDTAGTPSAYWDASSGYFGIGATAPSKGPLHVTTAHTGSQRAIVIENNNGGDAAIQFEDDTSPTTNVWVCGLDAGDSAKFKISQVELDYLDRLTITTGGLVGLGVNDPDEQLEVAGRIHISSEVAAPSAPAAGNGGILYTKADGKPYWISDDVAETDLTSGGGGGGGGSSLWEEDGDDIYYDTGRVGIGVTDFSGLYSFDVLNLYNDSSACFVNIDQGGTGDSGINFKYQGSTEWTIHNEGTGASSLFQIKSDDSGDVVTVKQDGNVGLGEATAPDTLLHLEQDGARLKIESNTLNASASIQIKATGNTEDVLIGQNLAVNGSLFEIYDNTDARSCLTIDGSGDVGIGLVAPSTKLHVEGAATDATSIGGIIRNTSSDQDALSRFSLGNDTTERGFDIQYVSSGHGTYGNDALIYNQHASGRLHLGNGNVGPALTIAEDNKIENHGDTLHVETISSGTTGSISENGMDQLIKVTHSMDLPSSFALTLPRPSDCPAGRRMHIWFQDGDAYYYHLKTSSTSDKFVLSYDIVWGDDHYEYCEAYGDSPILELISDGGTNWYSTDDHSAGGYWYSTDSPTT